MKGIIIIDVPIDDTTDFGHFDIRADVIVKGYDKLDFQSYLVEHAEVNPIPQKKDLRDYAEEIGADFNLQTRIMDYVNGYNKCIDDILRGAE